MEKQLNIHSLIVNVDSYDVVNLIFSPASTNRQTQPLVQAFHQVRLNHNFKEANQVAESLARMGSSQQEAFMYYITPPMFVLDILSFDIANSSVPNVNVVIETFVITETVKPVPFGLVLIDSLFNPKKRVDPSLWILVPKRL